MIRLHEIINIVNDLKERGELELAGRIASEYMDRLDSMELRFSQLEIAAKMGHTDQVMDLLETYLETRRWFSNWFLERSTDLNSLSNLPRYQNILLATGNEEEKYWKETGQRPLIQAPQSGKLPYPLFIAIHGNGFNVQHSAKNWACAAEQGWLVIHPLAKKLVGYSAHWWDAHEENQDIIIQQVSEPIQRFPIDFDRVVLGGFSKGGEVAMVLALQGWLKAKGFITVGAGGYYHMSPEKWSPLLNSSLKGLRGVTMVSPYDWERSGGVGIKSPTLNLLRAAGIKIRLIKYAAEGHVFPENFDIRFKKAANYILRVAR